jgi:hypothetical protein
LARPGSANGARRTELRTVKDRLPRAQFFENVAQARIGNQVRIGANVHYGIPTRRTALRFRCSSSRPPGGRDTDRPKPSGS